jgi:FHS family L-fucose permease-like MFS transporter
MGYLGDIYNMSVGFLMPMGCFVFIALYGYLWPRLSKTESPLNMSASHG